MDIRAPDDRLSTKGIDLTTPSASVAALRRIGLASTVFSFALVVWGAIVRINGAGMTCPDWPRCRGVWLPALDDPVVYEWTHRAAAILLTAAIAATFVAALRARAEVPSALRAAWVAVGLIFAQIVAGWLTIKYANNPPSVALHLVVGFSTFACLAAVTLFAYLASSPGAAASTAGGNRLRMSPDGFARLALVSAVFAFAAVFAAGWMSAANDGLACLGFPLCDGFGPARTLDQQVHMGHRFAAYATIAAVLVTWLAAMLTRKRERALLAIAWTSFGLVLLQAALGVLAVVTRLHPVLRSWHEANGALLVTALVLQAIVALRAAAAQPNAANLPQATPSAR